MACHLVIEQLFSARFKYIFHSFSAVCPLGGQQFLYIKKLKGADYNWKSINATHGANAGPSLSTWAIPTSATPVWRRTEESSSLTATCAGFRD